MKKKNVTPNSAQQNSLMPWAYLLLVLLITTMAYLPALQNGFTNYDERAYVTENPNIRNLNAETIRYHFGDFYMGNYHPLTMISYTIDYALFEKEAKGYIGMNIAWHLIACLFLFLLVYRISGKPLGGMAAALFFGLHPLHVESVAWIAERKDVLYTAFGIAALYTGYLWIESGKKALFLLTTFLFILACLSKGMAVVWAPVLIFTHLAYHYRAAGKWNWQLFKPSAFLIHYAVLLSIALIFGIVAIQAQQAAEAIRTDFSIYPVFALIAFPFYAIGFYLQKAILPFALSAHYGYPGTDNIMLYVSPLLVLLLIGGLWYMRKKAPEWLYGIVFYLIAISIVLQILPVGKAIAADRYFYFASVGIAIALGISLTRISKPLIAFGVIVLLSGFWFLKTQERIAVWKNSISLWSDTLKQNSDVPFVIFNLGVSLENKGKSEDQRAIELYQKAIRIDPEYFEPYNNLGILLNTYGRTQEAIPYYEKARQIKPNHSDTYNNLATAWQALKQYDQAMVFFEKALELNPENASPHNNMATMLNELGRTQEALGHYRTAASLNPGEPKVWYNLGNLFFQQNLPDSAEFYYLKSLSINPKYPDAMGNLGVVKFNQKDYAGAIEWYSKALQANPEFRDAYYNLGVVYYYMNDTNASLNAFQKAAALGHPGAIQWLQNKR